MYLMKGKGTVESFRARFAHVWRIRNGKAIGFEQVADSAKVREALR
jgi:ketosteroid isomerase-like protein